jgi:hypothetical protein
MSVLSFFPWLDVARTLDVGPIHLIPYRRGRQPGGAEQPIIDTLTEPYRITPRSSILTATLLRFGDRSLLEDIDDELLPELFELAALVTTAGLANRRFFGIGYWNRDNFQFLIQRFAEPDRGVFFEARRLDGSTGIYVPHENLVVSRPVHAGSGSHVEIDTILLQALLALREQDDWPRFREAIQVFNLASTDNPDIPMEVAVVLMTGAIEQLLGAAPKSADLVAKLESALMPRSTMTLAECPERVAKLPRGRTPEGSMRAAWIRDLFALRGDLAHGRLSARYRSVWSPREHLLMAAFCFPLLLRRELAARGLYATTDEDTDQIEAFEPLCCADHFATSIEDGDDASRSWHEILAEAGLERIVEKWRPQLEALFKKDEDDVSPPEGKSDRSNTGDVTA